MGVVRHLEAVATYPELRAAYNAAQPEVSAFYSGIPLHAGLWRAMQDFAATEEAARLEGERRRFLTKTIENFRRHGADLDPAGKQRLEEIDVELSRLTTKFAENVLDSTNAFELVITDPAGLAGLPPSAVAAARESAARKGREGWRFTLQAPDYFAVMTYLDDAASPPPGVRSFQRARDRGRARQPPADRAHSGIARAKRPACWASPISPTWCWKTAWRTRGARARVPRRSEGQDRGPLPRGESRAAGIPAVARRPGRRRIGRWDVAYYAEKQRAALYDFDEEALRPYFPLEQVVAGMFDLVHRLYGMRIEPQAGVPVWDEASAITTSTTKAANFWAASTPTGIRAKTSAAARGWMRSSPAARTARNSVRTWG